MNIWKDAYSYEWIDKTNALDNEHDISKWFPITTLKELNKTIKVNALNRLLLQLLVVFLIFHYNSRNRQIKLYVGKGTYKLLYK